MHDSLLPDLLQITSCHRQRVRLKPNISFLIRASSVGLAGIFYALLNGLRSFFGRIFVLCRRLLLLLFSRFVAELQVDRKMVRVNIRQPLHLQQLEMSRQEDMIQRPAKGKIISMKSIVEAPSGTGVQQAANLLKKQGGMRPGNIIEVACYQHRVGRFGDPVTDDQYFCIALSAVTGFTRYRGLGV